MNCKEVNKCKCNYCINEEIIDKMKINIDKKMDNIKYLFTQLFRYKNPNECNLYSIPKIQISDIDNIEEIMREYSISSVALYHLIHNFVGCKKFKELYNLSEQEYNYLIK